MKDDGDLRELLDSIDMDYWLDREGVSYTNTFGSSGPQLNIQECPSCGDSRSKVYIGEESGLGNCFVCDTSFNKFSFIRDYLGFSGPETFEHIKQVASEIGWRPKRKSVAVNSKSTKLKMPEFIKLPIKSRNLKYLESRGIDLSVVEYFNLQFAKKSWFVYERDGKERFQLYAYRIIIPIYDMEGNLVSFQGRDITGKAEKKYLFPPGHASTGKYLYNGHNAFYSKRIVINEGVFDVMATKIALDQDVDLRDVTPVGSFGKHLSYGREDCDDQIGKLIQLKNEGRLEEVTFMWDGESKAIIAALNAAKLVSEAGIVSKIAVLPKGKDPNEVHPSVVIDAFKEAMVYNKVNDVRLRLMHS